MLKTHMAACLVATALIAAPALAQTSAPSTGTAPGAGTAGSTAPAGTTAPGGTMAPAGGMAAGATASPAGGSSFITQREPGMFRASELIGKDVRGQNNEDIGEIGDILIDRNGQVRAVVVDVGGFLGIGETHVAVPMQSVQFRPDQQMGAGAAARTGTAGAPTGAAQTGATTATGTSAAPASTAPATGTAAQTQGRAGMPDAIIIVMTKEQLKSAPKFEDNARGAAKRNTSSTAPATNRGTTTAPRQ